MNIIVISSYQSWENTDPFIYYRDNHPGGYDYYMKKYNLPNIYPEKDNYKIVLEEKNTDENEIV